MKHICKKKETKRFVSNKY